MTFSESKTLLDIIALAFILILLIASFWAWFTSYDQPKEGKTGLAKRLLKSGILKKTPKK